jgi:hypothetical protein
VTSGALCTTYDLVLAGPKEENLMTKEQKQLLKTIGKSVVRNTGKKDEELAGVVKAVLPDGRLVVKDDAFGKIAVWPKGTWKLVKSAS